MTEVLRQEIVQVPAYDRHLQNTFSSSLIVPCKVSSSSVQYIVSTNLSEGSSSQMQFQPPVHPGLALEDQWLLTSNITVAYTYTNKSAVGGGFPLIENGNGLCSAPLMSSCSNIKLTINSSSVDNELDFLRNQFDLRCHEEQDLKDFEFSPLALDNTDRYSNFMLKRLGWVDANATPRVAAASVDNYYPLGEVSLANATGAPTLAAGARLELQTTPNPVAQYNALFLDDNVMNGSSKSGWNRGSFYPTAETGNATTAAAGVTSGTITYQVAEYINHPMLRQYSTSTHPKSLFNITSLNVNISLQPLQQLKRIFRTIANEALFEMNITSVTFSNATLTIPYATVDLQKLRQNCIIPFFQKKYYNNDNPTFSMTSGLSTTSTTNTQVLNTIPHYVAIWVSPYDIVNPANIANSLADWNFRIDSLSIDYSNRPNLLSNASPAQLFSMTKANGFRQYKWNDIVGKNNVKLIDTWAHGHTYVSADLRSGNTSTLVGSSLRVSPLPGCGSWVVLAFGSDIQIDSGLTPGMTHNANFSIKVGFTNNSLYTRTGHRTHFMLLDKNFFEIVVGGSSNRNGIIDRKTVQEGILEMNDPKNKLQFTDNMLVGGGWFSDLKSKVFKFLPTVKSGLRTVNKYASMIDHPLAQGVAEASNLGADALQSQGFGHKKSMQKKYA